MSTSPPYHLITPDDLHWRPSNLMKIPNADFLERTGSEKMGARLWRMPPRSANTLHKHIRAEEFYFVLDGFRVFSRALSSAQTVGFQRFSISVVIPNWPEKAHFFSTTG